MARLCLAGRLDRESAMKNDSEQLDARYFQWCVGSIHFQTGRALSHESGAGRRKEFKMPKRGTIQLLAGFIFTFWGGVSALLTRFATSPAVQGGEVGIAIVCLASGAIFFVAGFIQVCGHPRRVATMLDMLF